MGKALQKSNCSLPVAEKISLPDVQGDEGELLDRKEKAVGMIAMTWLKNLQVTGP